MLTELRKNEVYMWINPKTASGLKFKVVRILWHSYLLRYLNYPHAVTKNNEVVEISSEFMNSHLMDVLKVSGDRVSSTL